MLIENAEEMTSFVEIVSEGRFGKLFGAEEAKIRKTSFCVVFSTLKMRN